MLDFYPIDRYVPTYTGLKPDVSFEMKLIRRQLCFGWPDSLVQLLVRHYVIPAVCAFELNRVGLAPLAALIHMGPPCESVLNVWSDGGPACQRLDWPAHRDGECARMAAARRNK